MSLARLKSWVSAEVLYASDLNAEFSNVLDNALSLISPLTGSLDVNGKDLTAIDELAFSDAAGSASAAGRLRRNAGALTWADAAAHIHQIGTNWGIGTVTFGTSADNVLALFNGTPPSTSPVDTVQMWAADLAAGHAGLWLRDEDGVVQIFGYGAHTFSETSDPATPAADRIALYAKDTNGVTNLHTKDAAGNVLTLGQTRIAGTGTDVALLGGVVDMDNSSVGTDADTNAKVLHSHSIGANTMATVGDAIHITANGLLAANGNNKTVNLRLSGVGGTILVGTGVVATSGAMWDLDVWVVRSGTNTIDAHGSIRVGAAGAAVGAVSVHRAAYAVNEAVTLTSAWTLDVQGLNGTASANDVTCRFSRSIYLPAA